MMKIKLQWLAGISCLCLVPALPATILFSQLDDDLFVVNDGAYDAGTGVFSYAADEDSRQGVLASFDAWSLSVGGKAVEATFSLAGGTDQNNRNQALAIGLFSGTAVTANGQTTASDDWTGYFHAIGARDGNNAMRFGIYRQGAGTQPLMDREVDWFGASASVDGQGGQITGGPRPPYNQDVTTQFTVRLEQVSATELSFTTIFATPREDSAADTRTGGGLSTTASVTDGIATISTTHPIASGGPTSIDGIAIMGLGDFTITDLTVIPEPSTYAAVLGLFALAGLIWRRRERA